MTTSAALARQTFGSGKAVVLALHGWHGGRWSFEPIVPALDLENYTWICPEYRGYGESAHIGGRYTMAEAAADCAALLKTEGIEHAHVLGHSMGAKVAQLVALDGGIGIDSLIALTPVPASGIPFDDATFAMFAESTRSVEGIASMLENATAENSGSVWARRLAQRIWHGSGTSEVLLAYLRDWAYDDFSARVRGLPVKTHVIVGEHDRALNEDAMRGTFLEWIPGCSLATVGGAAHYPMDEAPLRLGAIIERALST